MKILLHQYTWGKTECKERNETFLSIGNSLKSGILETFLKLLFDFHFP